MSIVGAEKNSLNSLTQENIYVHEVENNEQNLIKFYDDHNIFVLPSYTEGHPMVLLESLARLRPVIIFKDIEHVIGDKKGIFVAERNSNSFFKTIDHIKENYKNIQREMKENELPTKDELETIRPCLSLGSRIEKIPCLERGDVFLCVIKNDKVELDYISHNWWDKFSMFRCVFEAK